MMSKKCVFHLPSNPADMIHTFNLSKVIKNTRTSVYQNKDVRFSIDQKVVRVLLYDDQNAELLEKIRCYFYGENYEKL